MSGINYIKGAIVVQWLALFLLFCVGSLQVRLPQSKDMKLIG